MRDTTAKLVWQRAYPKSSSVSSSPVWLRNAACDFAGTGGGIFNDRGELFPEGCWSVKVPFSLKAAELESLDFLDY